MKFIDYTCHHINVAGAYYRHVQIIKQSHIGQEFGNNSIEFASEINGKTYKLVSAMRPSTTDFKDGIFYVRGTNKDLDTRSMYMVEDMFKIFQTLVKEYNKINREIIICCGKCMYYIARTSQENLGDCIYPLPACIEYSYIRMVKFSDGGECKCFVNGKSKYEE